MLKRYILILFVFLYCELLSAEEDSFTLDGIKQQEVDAVEKKDSSYWQELGKKINFTAGTLPTLTPNGTYKTSSSVTLSYKDSWKDFSFSVAGEYAYSRYTVFLTPEKSVFTPNKERLPDIKKTISYSKFLLKESVIKYSPSEYFVVSLGRQNITWGQVDGLSMISLFILPITDNIITFQPNKTDLLYPQDIISLSLFPTSNNEVTFYYFVNPRLSPLFNQAYGKEILTNAPPVWAARYTNYGKNSIFAITYFDGISFLGGKNKGLQLFNLGGGNFYKIDNTANKFNSSEDGPPITVTDINSYAKSKALAFEFSYNFNAKWSLKGEIVGDITEKFLPLENISTNPDKPTNYRGFHDKIQYLEFVSTNGPYYNSTTIFSTLELNYSGTRWDTSVSVLGVTAETNLFSGKDVNDHASDDFPYGKKFALPLLTTKYSFNDDKTKGIGYFLGNQGGLFGTGIYYMHEYNQYVSFGAIGGAYRGLSDFYDLIRAFTNAPDGYDINDAKNRAYQFSVALQIKL